MIHICSPEWELLGSHGITENIENRKYNCLGRREEGGRGHGYLVWMVREGFLNMWPLSLDTDKKKQQNIPRKTHSKHEGPKVRLSSVLLKNTKIMVWSSIMTKWLNGSRWGARGQWQDP